MAGRLGGGYGLDALAPQPAVQPQGAGHPALQQLIQILASEPNLDPSFSQGLLQQAMGNITGQQQQRQQAGQAAFDSASQGLMGLATSGYGTPQGLEALTGAYQSMSPQLNRPALSGRLEGLTSSLGGVAATVPAAGGSETTPPIFAADIPAIVDDISKAISGDLKQPNDQPYGLHEIMVHVISQYRAQGASPQDIDALQRFVIAKWKELGGSERPGGGYSMP